MKNTDIKFSEFGDFFLIKIKLFFIVVGFNL